MKSDPKTSSQEVLAGLVERVTFHNAENGFCVLTEVFRQAAASRIVQRPSHGPWLDADLRARLASDRRFLFRPSRGFPDHRWWQLTIREDPHFPTLRLEPDP